MCETGYIATVFDLQNIAIIIIKCGDEVLVAEYSRL